MNARHLERPSPSAIPPRRRVASGVSRRGDGRRGSVLDLSPELCAEWERRALQNPRPLSPAGLAWIDAMREAVDLARVAEARWEPELDPTTGSEALPGLRQSAPHLSPAVVDEILALWQLSQRAQWAWLNETAPLMASDPRPRAELMIAELDAALDLGIGDGAAERLDLETLRAMRGSSSHAGELAVTLDDYASLTERLGLAAQGLHGLGATLRVARATIESLREVSDRAAPADPLRRLRDGLYGLLCERVRRVRAAARFVFRDHPEVLREFSSARPREAAAAGML